MTSSGAIDDPFEARNRQIHEFNKGVDSVLLRPASAAGGGGVGRTVTAGLGNLADTADTPRRVVNNLLQGRIENAGHNTFRLLTNLTFGFGGLLDPATSMGLPPRDTDFGETLHVWGSGEGAFVEVPLMGPSTQRDTVGDVVDIALNPVGWVEGVGPVALAAGIWLLDGLADRGRFGSAIDDVLYGSADSYAQTRLIYLQNRRFELARNAGQAAGVGGIAPGTEGAVVDPYADPYGEGIDPYADPAGGVYIDPYEDPYAQ